MSDEATTMNATAELVERVLSDPQLLEVVTNLAKDLPADDTQADAKDTKDSTEDTTQTLSQDDSTHKDEHGYDAQRRHTLLCAIKPYLSENRAKMLDSMEAFANLLELFRKS